MDLPFGIARRCQPLAAYLIELKYRADMLEWAYVCDDRFETAEPPESYHPDSKRRWTRQDGNRLNYQYEYETFHHHHPGTHWDDEPEWLQELESRPQRTRVGWLCWLYRHPKYSIQRLHAFALQQAQEVGIYAVVAPLIAECSAASEGLIDMYAKTGDWEYRDEWTPDQESGVHDRLRTAIEQLRLYLPAAIAEEARSFKLSDQAQDEEKPAMAGSDKQLSETAYLAAQQHLYQANKHPDPAKRLEHWELFTEINGTNTVGLEAARVFVDGIELSSPETSIQVKGSDRSKQKSPGMQDECVIRQVLPEHETIPLMKKQIARYKGCPKDIDDKAAWVQRQIIAGNIRVNGNPRSRAKLTCDYRDFDRRHWPEILRDDHPAIVAN